MDLEEFKERSKAFWGMGDYTTISNQLEPASEALVESLGIGEGQRVLDIASGHGNCAIAAANRGASAVATDLSPVMIDRGSRRTEGLALDIEWREAEASDLPFEDASFDRVTSVFGAIFAPDQAGTAAEAVRVLKPGGKLGFTAWTPDSYVARVIEVTSRHAPPRPDGAPDPFFWGHPEEVQALFASLGCTAEARRKTITFTYSDFGEWRASSESHGGAVMAKETMPPETYEQLFGEMQALAEAHNRGGDDIVLLDADYLELIASKP